MRSRQALHQRDGVVALAKQHAGPGFRGVRDEQGAAVR